MKVSNFMHEMRQTSRTFGRNSKTYVTFEGKKAFTDGQRINLPAMSLDATLTNQQVMVMRGYVDHEAGHNRHSDMKRIVSFYKKCLNNDKKGLRDIHNCVEDVWMEQEVMKDYPGSHKNLSAVNKAVKAKELQSRKDTRKFVETGDISHIDEIEEDVKKHLKDNPGVIPEMQKSVGESLDGFNSDNVGCSIKTANPAFFVEGTDDILNELMDDMPERVQEFSKMWAQMATECASTEDCITLAKSIYKLLEEDPKLESNPEDFDPTAGEGMDEGEEGDVDESEAMSGVLGEVAGKAGKSDGGEGKNLGEGEGLSAREMLGDDYMPSPEEMVTSESGDGMGGIGGMNGPLVGGYSILTDKDDVEYKRGRPLKQGGERYVQEILDSSDPTEYMKVKSEISGTVAVMKNKLRAALQGKDKRDWDTGRQAGVLDRKRLVAGVLGNPSVYKVRTDRAEMNTAVTVLTDLSGSMGGRKAVVTRDCTVALSECLEGTGISFKIVGFCNKGYPDYKSQMSQVHRIERLDTIIFKDFDQPVRTAYNAIARLPDTVGGNNSDYDFIQNELAYLKARPEQRKVLFVLSDGHPAHMSNASTSEIIRHCKEAIKQGSKDGIECIGLGICDSSVTKIYKDNVVVNDVSDLSTTVFRKLTKLLV